jgi:glucokinase
VDAAKAVRVDGRSIASPMLGLDIGGTKLAAGVVDPDGGVHGFVTAATDPDGRAGVERLLELGREAIAEAGLQVDGVGIGCGGPLDTANGVLVAPFHLAGWHGIPVGELGAEGFGRPAVLDNDAVAGAAGEHRYGAGRGTRDMVYLTISTGVGGGVVIDGQLHRARSGNGGELGHVTVDWHGRRCRGCGRRGCLEAYCSGTSIAERANEVGMHGATASDVAEAARAGNPTAGALWDETCEALACGIVSIANLFEPEVVVLGGGVVRTGEQLLGPVRELVRAQTIGPSVEIRQAALGDAVGVVGAAAVAYERLATR